MYHHPEVDYYSIDNDKLFIELKEYLKNEEFQYKSQAEIEIDNLIKGAVNQNEIKNELLNIKNELAGLFDKELLIYKREILREIKSELAARYLGMEGRIREQLNYDKQVQAALGIFLQNDIYNKLLNIR